MNRKDQIACGRRALAHVENGTTDMVESVMFPSASSYTDVEILNEEKRVLFRKYPILVGLSNDFAEPGDYKADTYLDVPVLVVRDKDGEMKAYLNICPHRASPLAEGCGNQKRFTCPYHAWTFGLEGQLLALPGKEGFSGIDKDTIKLKPLPVMEKHGMIWVGLDEGASVDIDRELGPLKADFEAYDYGSYHHYQTIEIYRDMNWKLVIDTFLENYHLQVLHRNSIAGSILSNCHVFDTSGTCNRNISPRDTLQSDFRSKPEEEWDLVKHSAISYVLFPNTLFIMQSDHAEIWRAFPDGDNPNRSKIYFDVYVPKPAVTEKAKKYWDANIDYGVEIVLNEDFPLAEKNQRAFMSNTIDNLIFGRNEAPLVHFHQVIDSLLAEAAEPKISPSLSAVS